MSWSERLFGWNGPGQAMVVQTGADAPVQAYGTLDLKGDLAMALGGYSSLMGQPVTEETAMRNVTFQRAATLISSAIAMLPLNLHERSSDGTIGKADSHPVYRLLRRRPNANQTPFEFKSYMQGRALLHGDAYAYKVPGVRGYQALWPLDPRRITPEQDPVDFSLRYKYQPKKGSQRIFRADELFHLRAPWSNDGITGEGLLKLAADALGLAGGIDAAAAGVLRNAAQPGGFLSHPKTLSADAIAKLRAQWREHMQGAENAGRWIVAEEGMEAKPFAPSGKDAETVAQRKFQAEELARATGVPRPLLMFDDTSWGSGIQALGLFLVTYCLAPWFVAWEEAVSRDLLSEAEQDRLYAKFNDGALLRGSLAEQAEFFAKALGGPGAAGFMVPDEARDKMDMNPLPDGIGQQPAWMQAAAQGTNNGA